MMVKVSSTEQMNQLLSINEDRNKNQMETYQSSLRRIKDELAQSKKNEDRLEQIVQQQYSQIGEKERQLAKAMEDAETLRKKLK